MAAARTTNRRTAAKAKHLWLTDDREAAALLADEPMAFVIGFILDQQITVQKAFRAGLDLQVRLGSIDAATIAATKPAKLEKLFTEKPALHRYPKAMAARVQEAAQVIVDRYDGDAGRIWWEADDLDDLRARYDEVPGLKGNKWISMTAVLAQLCGVPITGWESSVMPYGSLGDVESLDDLSTYQLRKNTYKRAVKAAEADGKSERAAAGAGVRALKALDAIDPDA